MAESIGTERVKRDIDFSAFVHADLQFDKNGTTCQLVEVQASFAQAEAFI